MWKLLIHFLKLHFYGILFYSWIILKAAAGMATG
jgi:hypothetical protein